MLNAAVAGITGRLVLTGVGLCTYLYYLYDSANAQKQPPHRNNGPSSSRNRTSAWSGQATDCYICKREMRNSTIKLNCSHIFHDECYKIWRELMIAANSSASLCPRC